MNEILEKYEEFVKWVKEKNKHTASIINAYGSAAGHFGESTDFVDTDFQTFMAWYKSSEGEKK